MRPGQAEAERQEQGLNAFLCPGAPEEEADPKAQICPAAQTQGCLEGLQSWTEASGGSDPREADRTLRAGRPIDLLRPKERGKIERRLVGGKK